MRLRIPTIALLLAAALWPVSVSYARGGRGGGGGHGGGGGGWHEGGGGWGHEGGAEREYREEGERHAENFEHHDHAENHHAEDQHNNHYGERHWDHYHYNPYNHPYWWHWHPRWGPAYPYYTYNYIPGWWFAPYGYAYYGGPTIVFQNYEENTTDWPQESQPNLQDHGADLSAKGWSSLAAGDEEDAEDDFESVIDDHPRLGLPRVGLALATAEQGNLPKAVIEMRRAVAYDPSSLNAVPKNSNMRSLIQDVLGRYQGTVGRSSHQADPNFMIACLLYMNGDKQGARTSLALAVKAGDTSGAATNLQKLLSSS